MNTAIATQPPIHHPRRQSRLSAAFVATLAFGAGAAVVALTSSSSSTSPEPRAATAPAAGVDIEALWNRLITLPVSERDNAVASLAPGVRAQLKALAEGLAAAAPGH